MLSEKTPEIHGVKFDSSFSFTHHVSMIVDRAKKSLKTVKYLAGASWGRANELLTTAYKATCRNVMIFGGPVWHHHISNTKCEKMKRIERGA